ncbi:MAG: agmatine deiminase family protein [Elusimicrobiota bacterium]|jgi:agmatine deiminase
MKSTPRKEGFSMPAEWDAHEAIWLSWPHDPVSFEGVLPRVEDAYVRIISEIHRTERVELFILDENMRLRAEEKLSGAGVDLGRVRMHLFDYADVWIRDYGPSFVVDAERRRAAMVHWIFNAWGNKYEELLKDTRIPEHMEKVLGLPRCRPGIVMEGGSIDVNGAGTVLTTEQCLLNKNRNPRLDRAAIEDKLKDHLGARNILWLKEGVAGDDTDGHIDDIARFAGPRIVLCAVEDRKSDANAAVLRENLRLLSGMRDQDGKSLEIVTLPMPDPVEFQGRRLPASYANFYIGNGVVLAPVFGCPNDEKALEVLEKVFPGRRIAPVNCRELVQGLGTIHCASQQQPKVLSSNNMIN